MCCVIRFFYLSSPERKTKNEKTKKMFTVSHKWNSHWCDTVSTLLSKRRTLLTATWPPCVFVYSFPSFSLFLSISFTPSLVCLIFTSVSSTLPSPPHTHILFSVDGILLLIFKFLSVSAANVCVQCPGVHYKRRPKAVWLCHYSISDNFSLDIIVVWCDILIYFYLFDFSPVVFRSTLNFQTTASCYTHSVSSVHFSRFHFVIFGFNNFYYLFCSVLFCSHSASQPKKRKKQIKTSSLRVVQRVRIFISGKSERKNGRSDAE